MIREERRLLDKTSKTNRLHGLYREGDFVLLALSGGADSAALAGIFSVLRRTHKLRLAAAHLNHGLSPQAPRFEKAACETARRLDIPFYRASALVAKRARRARVSVEEAGRDARYAFFKKLARRLRANAVATAHTRDDQVETVLFRFFRGTSLQGLAGIPYRRALDGKIAVIRPLLDFKKTDLFAYAQARKLPSVTDRSNQSGRHRRNRIRHELLPLIERRLNPSAREAIVRLQQSCLDWLPVVNAAVDEAWKNCHVRVRSSRLTLARPAFQRLGDALRQEIFMRAAERIGVARKPLGRVHAETMRSLPSRGTIDFPGLRILLNARQIVWKRLP